MISACRGVSFCAHVPLGPDTRTRGEPARSSSTWSTVADAGLAKPQQPAAWAAARRWRRRGSAATPGRRRDRRAGPPGPAPTCPRPRRRARRRRPRARHRPPGPAVGQPLPAADPARLDARRASSIDVSRAAITTSASSAGCMPRDGPLTSTTPSVRPDHGSTERRSGAPPAGVRLHEVLRALDLHSLAEHQTGADRVGADVALGPRRAADEAEPVGEAAYPRAAGAPQHAAVGVGDYDHLAGVDHRGQCRIQAGHQRRQVARRTTALELAHGQRRPQPARIPAPARTRPPAATKPRSWCAEAARRSRRSGPCPGSGGGRARPTPSRSLQARIRVTRSVQPLATLPPAWPGVVCSITQRR